MKDINQVHSLAVRLAGLLAAAAVAWIVLNAEATLKVEVSMKAHVDLKVHGETGVRVGPGNWESRSAHSRLVQLIAAIRSA